MTQMLSSISPASVPAAQKTGLRPDPSDSAEAQGAEKAQADNPGAGATENATPEAPAFDIGAGLSIATGEDTKAYQDAIEQYFSAVQASNDAQAAVAGSKLQVTFSKMAQETREYIAYLEPLDPIPRRTLTDDEAEDARTRFANAEPAMVSKSGAQTFLENGFMFRFEPDGQVTTRHQNIPVSEEAKQKLLKELGESLDYYLKASEGLPVEQLERRQAQAQERAGAAAERAESLKAAMEQTRPGQLVDSRA